MATQEQEEKMAQLKAEYVQTKVKLDHIKQDISALAREAGIKGITGPHKSKKVAE